MKVLNIGSINIDYVYGVEHFVRPGETLGSQSYHRFAGGKGFNQSVALARAGVPTLHAGRVGAEGDWLIQRLKNEGVDTRCIQSSATPTGHAIIQVVPAGENAIVLYGGANHCLTDDDVRSAISACAPGDYLLLQNETSSIPYAMQAASQQNLRIVFNPAPMTQDLREYPLDLVDLFILNETEAQDITGAGGWQTALDGMRQLFPEAATVLTLGAKGAIYADKSLRHFEAAQPVTAVDTTAAGDTFIGYFLSEWIQMRDPRQALAKGCRAAAHCVTKAGASDSIPYLRDL